MTAQTLSYADVVQADPLPALRRIRTLAFVWAILVGLYSAMLLARLLLWPKRGYASDEHVPTYFERTYWYLDLASPTAAALTLMAAFTWRRSNLDQPNRTVAALAIASATVVFTVPAWHLVMGLPLNWAPGFQVHYVQFTNAAVLAVVPATMALAAISPARFVHARLAVASGIATFLFAAMFGSAMAAFMMTLLDLSGSDFWRYVVSWWSLLLIVSCTLATTVLFVVGAIGLRRGRSGCAATVASWIALASVFVWTIAGALGGQYADSYYWQDIVTSITWSLMMMCLGLAFLGSLRQSHERSGPASPTMPGTA